MSDKFDWYDDEDKAIVIPPTRGVAVYISDRGFLVIKQERDSLNLEDIEILINPRDIELFVLAVTDAASKE